MQQYGQQIVHKSQTLYMRTTWKFTNKLHVIKIAKRVSRNGPLKWHYLIFQSKALFMTSLFNPMRSARQSDAEWPLADWIKKTPGLHLPHWSKQTLLPGNTIEQPRQTCFAGDKEVFFRSTLQSNILCSTGLFLGLKELPCTN